MNGKLTQQTWFVYALVPVCALMWGMSYLGTSVTLQHLSVTELLALRWAVGALFFTILIALRIVKVDYKGKSIKALLLVGLLQPCIYAIFETLGIKYTTTSESSIFIATIPLAVLIIGGLFLKKKTGIRTIFAIILAFAGVVICVAFSPGFSLGGKGMGYLYLLVAVISGALYTHASSKASQEFAALEVTYVMTVMGAVTFNLINLAAGNGLQCYAICFSDLQILLGVLFLGICCSCFSYLIYNFVLGKLPTAIGTNLVTNSVTAVGVVSGCLFAGDPFGWYTVIGVLLTITGVCISSLGNKES